MTTLDNLITAAMQLAGNENVSHNRVIWQQEGGRSCPIGWEDCSQAVYIDVATGDYDYGERGGPGWTDCQQHCQHGQKPPDYDA